MSDRAVIKGHTITKTLVVDAPRDEVWAIISEPARIAEWFSDVVDLPSSEVGATGTLTWEGYGTFPARVEANTARESFAFRWASEPAPEVTDDNSTVATFTLADAAAGTAITVVESGFEKLSGGTAYRRRRLEENRDGWDVEFAELAALFE